MADLDRNYAVASIKSLRVSPRKLGYVAALIRNLRAEQALVQLSFCQKRIATDVKKCLLSAIANAENNYNIDIDSLHVSEVLVGKSTVMRRFRARARGRGARILKPFSNLKIVVTSIEEN